jgi:hypothetical protein
MVPSKEVALVANGRSFSAARTRSCRSCDRASRRPGIEVVPRVLGRVVPEARSCRPWGSLPASHRIEIAAPRIEIAAPRTRSPGRLHRSPRPTPSTLLGEQIDDPPRQISILRTRKALRCPAEPIFSCVNKGSREGRSVPLSLKNGLRSAPRTMGFVQGNEDHLRLFRFLVRLFRSSCSEERSRCSKERFPHHRSGEKSRWTRGAGFALLLQDETPKGS